MKIIEEKAKKVIYLEEGDLLEIKTFYKNNVTITVHCKEHVLYVDDIVDKRIKEIQLEQQEIKKMFQKK